jgi:membrane protein required for colicin V production
LSFQFSTVDWVIAAVVLVSLLLGILRGATREILSLAGWVAGLVLAFLFADQVGAALPLDLPMVEMRTALGAILILVAVLIVAALLGAILRALMAAVKLSAVDRVLGGVFGLARAGLVLGLAVVLASATQAPKSGWWKESVLLPWLEVGVASASPLLPESLARLQPDAGR